MQLILSVLLFSPIFNPNGLVCIISLMIHFEFIKQLSGLGFFLEYMVVSSIRPSQYKRLDFDPITLEHDKW